MQASNPAQVGGLRRRSLILGVATTAAFASKALHVPARGQTPADPLASWNEGPAKQAILSFVRATTDPSNKNFVVVKDRIATFDQDGTLWVEHPLYAQAMFALDRLRAMAPDHPEWNSIEPFKTVLSGDLSALIAFTEKDWAEIVGVTHAGMSNDAFMDIVASWLQTAEHPRFKRPYTQLVYQPMLEVMEHLRANGFKTYIVTGGGQEFVRVYAEHVYGVPPEQVVGSSIVTQYQMKGDQPILMRMPKPFFIDDGVGKPIGINMFIGKRPYAAFGNSDGDRAMLEWTAAGAGARLEMLVHHDDPTREYAYGPAGSLPDTKLGTFSDALMAESQSHGWSVISMKSDWKRIFPFDPG
ncbi:MAG TPA: HAD family hydrolase [Acetobacteraceae bacterium]|jgi:phosphoglycolate phosphatase-like HAD superfamily hydrolase|nr:HAD family hydrolase [Acetobacteraceae bacterium]